MDRILISSCLIGRRVRYNGSDKSSDAKDIIKRWVSEGRLVPHCPEVMVGFPTPRPPAEIKDPRHLMEGSFDGSDVLEWRARVVEYLGRDVTDMYVQAARDTVDVALRNGCRHAVLTNGSPSCGTTFIYDGSFSSATKPGMGVTAAALRDAGLQVWPETAIRDLDAQLRSELKRIG